MISCKIVDNDMGSVLKVPLTGVGTVYGIDISVDSFKLPQYNCNIVEMCRPDMGIERFTDFVEEHLADIVPAAKAEFVKYFTSFATGKRKEIIRVYN